MMNLDQALTFAAIMDELMDPNPTFVSSCSFHGHEIGIDWYCSCR
jgi:hypothetical protein